MTIDERIQKIDLLAAQRPAAKETAKLVARCFPDSVAIEVGATVAGGIQLEYHAKSMALEIEVSPCGLVGFFFKSPSNRIDWGLVHFHSFEAYALLCLIKDRIA